MKQKNIDDLNREYSEAESVDSEIFAEMRSNILLYAGDHYSKKGSKFFNRVRDARDMSSEQKLRLTKNHTQRICKAYVNSLLTYSPSVTSYPHNESELQDIKAAELNKAVLEDAKIRYRRGEFYRKAAQHLVRVGEVFSLVTWDPMKGKLVGYEQELDEMGQPVVEDNGEPKSSGKAVFSGDFTFKHILACNVLRSPNAKTIEDSPYLIFREMAAIEEVKARVGDDEELLKCIDESQDDTYVVFDSSTSNYAKSTGQCLLRYHFYRPCFEYPLGYFFLTTNKGILFEGELPFGIWPIASAGFDDIEDHPRARSIIKVVRPYQAEVNRSASKIAETQVTLGDDKVVMFAGGKLTDGAKLPGIRQVTSSGQVHSVIPGRSGEQYLPYMSSQIAEMYQAAMVEEELTDKNEAQVDPYMALYKSMKQKKKFSVLASKFTQYQIDLETIFLSLAKKYYTDEMFIRAVGRSERINIEEFRNLDDNAASIRLEEQSDDVESKLGRQLSMNHLLQYVGPQLSRSDIGKVMQNMPFANVKEQFSDLTLDYECVSNDILALDRGEQPQLVPGTDIPYYLKKIGNRMKKGDFRYLDQQIKQNYESFMTLLKQTQAQEIAAAQRAKDGFIPVGGALIAADMYVNDPQNPQKAPKRVRLPYQAVDWLLKGLEAQGVTLSSLEQMQGNVKADIGNMLGTQGAPNQAIQQGAPNNVRATNDRGTSQFIGSKPIGTPINQPGISPGQPRPIGPGGPVPQGQPAGQPFGGGENSIQGPGYR